MFNIGKSQLEPSGSDQNIPSETKISREPQNTGKIETSRQTSSLISEPRNLPTFYAETESSDNPSTTSYDMSPQFIRGIPHATIMPISYALPQNPLIHPPLPLPTFANAPISHLPIQQPYPISFYQMFPRFSSQSCSIQAFQPVYVPPTTPPKKSYSTYSTRKKPKIILPHVKLKDTIEDLNKHLGQSDIDKLYQPYMDLVNHMIDSITSSILYIQTPSFIYLLQCFCIEIERLNSTFQLEVMTQQIILLNLQSVPCHSTRYQQLLQIEFNEVSQQSCIIINPIFQHSPTFSTDFSGSNEIMRQRNQTFIYNECLDPKFLKTESQYNLHPLQICENLSQLVCQVFTQKQKLVFTLEQLKLQQHLLCQALEQVIAYSKNILNLSTQYPCLDMLGELSNDLIRVNGSLNINLEIPDRLAPCLLRLKELQSKLESLSQNMNSLSITPIACDISALYHIAEIVNEPQQPAPKRSRIDKISVQPPEIKISEKSHPNERSKSVITTILQKLRLHTSSILSPLDFKKVIQEQLLPTIEKQPSSKVLEKLNLHVQQELLHQQILLIQLQVILQNIQQCQYVVYLSSELELDHLQLDQQLQRFYCMPFTHPENFVSQRFKNYSPEHSMQVFLANHWNLVSKNHKHLLDLLNIKFQTSPKQQDYIQYPTQPYIQKLKSSLHQLEQQHNIIYKLTSQCIDCINIKNFSISTTKLESVFSYLYAELELLTRSVQFDIPLMLSRVKSILEKAESLGIKSKSQETSLTQQPITSPSPSNKQLSLSPLL